MFRRLQDVNRVLQARTCLRTTTIIRSVRIAKLVRKLEKTALGQLRVPHVLQESIPTRIKIQSARLAQLVRILGRLIPGRARVHYVLQVVTQIKHLQ